MPLYELFCISRANIPLDYTKNLLKKSSLVVMTGGGVVRKLENYGENKLAYKMRKNHDWFDTGRQWSMKFDANPTTVQELNQQLKLDPVVIRHGIVKVGKKLNEKVPDMVSRDEVYASLIRQKLNY